MDKRDKKRKIKKKDKKWKKDAQNVYIYHFTRDFRLLQKGKHRPWVAEELQSPSAHVFIECGISYHFFTINHSCSAFIICSFNLAFFSLFFVRDIFLFYSLFLPLLFFVNVFTTNKYEADLLGHDERTQNMR